MKSTIANRNYIIVFALSSMIYSVATRAVEPSVASEYGNNIFAPSEVLGVSEYKKDITSYPEGQLKTVIGVKKLLNEFFVGLQKQDASVESLLTSNLQKQYPDVGHLYGRITKDEGIIEFRIFDFDFSNNLQSLTIRLDLKTTNEGTLCTYQHAITLQQIEGAWKIADIK